MSLNATSGTAGGPAPTLIGSRVTLRAARASDIAERLALGRDPEFVRLCGGDPSDLKPFTAEDAEEFYRATAASPTSWVIQHEGRCIGSARLHSLDAANRRARFAIGIFDPACWGSGLGVETTRLVLSHAFDTLGLHRIDLRVLEENGRAIRAYEKCGFVMEGVEREGALIAGVWKTDVMMSILETEYRSLAPGWDLTGAEG